MPTNAPAAASEVVLVHSSGMSSRQWKRLAATLSARHHVTAPDLVGSGDEPLWPDEQPFHFSMDVERLERLVRALPTPAHIIGHSYGGLLALMLALRAPDRVRSLTLYDPVAFGVLYDADDRAGLDDLEAVMRDLVDDRGGPRWYEAFVDYWNGKGTWRALPEAQRAAFLRTGRKVYYEVTTLASDRTRRAAYTALAMPVLLLTGERSPPAARRVIEHLVGALPDVRRVEIAGAGHMGPISHADEVNARIVDFLGTVA